MKYKILFLSIFSILAVIFFISCSAKTNTSSYYYAQKQLEHGQIDFHNSIRIDEYLNAFKQPGVVVKQGEDVQFQFDSFYKETNGNIARNFIQFLVKTRLPTRDERREPISLCFVLDISGSMSVDNKIKDAISALKNGVNELKDGDEFSLVTFNTQVNALIPKKIINQTTRSEIIEIINGILPGGGTDIELGLIKGYEEIAKFKMENNQRLILLTDGISPVELFTPQEYSKAANVVLDKPVQISTIGLGINVQEEILRKVASEGNGFYYFAENSKTLTSILVEDLNSMMIPVLTDLTINFNFSNSVKIINSYGINDSLVRIGQFYFEQKNMYVDDWRVFLFEVEKSNNMWATVPVTALISFKKSDGETISKKIDQEFVSTDSMEQLEYNSYVARNSVLYSNAKSMIKVGELAEEEKYDEAINILNLQINNNNILQEKLDDKDIKEEITKLNSIKNIVLRKKGESGNNRPETIALVTDSLVAKEETKSSRIIKKGIELGLEVLPGPWKTIAELFLIIIE